MLNIEIETIPHKNQRYDTLGDYFEHKDGSISFRISEMKDWRYEALVAVHELIEKILCMNKGIKNEDIDKFDMRYEKEREQGGHGIDDEPGDDYHAPYRNEHLFATGIEKLVCAQMGIPWKMYEAACSNAGLQWGKNEKNSASVHSNGSSRRSVV